MKSRNDCCQTPLDAPAAPAERVDAVLGPAVPRHRVRARFYQELGDFLAHHRRGREFELKVADGTTTKALVEHCGVPHGEVDLLLVDSESVDFGYRLRDGQRVSVYPVFESFDISALTRVRPAPLRAVRFLVDANLAKLAVLLRMCGLDASDAGLLLPGAADQEDARLVTAARREQRIILTRDRRLLERKAVTHGCFVRSQDPEQQLLFVLHRFHLAAALRPFSPLHALQRAVASGRQGGRPAPPAAHGAGGAAVVQPLPPLPAPLLARQPLAAHAPPPRRPARRSGCSGLLAIQGCMGMLAQRLCATICGHIRRKTWIQSMYLAYAI